MSSTNRSSAASVVIRRAVRADKNEWLRMRLLLWPQADPANEAGELDSMLQDEDAPVFVAERSGVGLCGLLEAGMRRSAEGYDTGFGAHLAPVYRETVQLIHFARTL